MYNRFISLIGFIISICSIVYLFKLRADTKEDIFKQPFKIGQKEKLFHSQNISSITSSEFGIKCELYQEAIMSPKVDKLGYVFDLNIENIHKRTTQLVIIFVLLILFIFLLIVILILIAKTESLMYIFLLSITIIANYALYIANFVITILLILAFYKGDAHNFVEFLSCKNINTEEFNKYSFAKELQKDFTIFFILNIVSIFLNYQTSQAAQINKQKEKKRIPEQQPSVEVVVNK